jgi:rod shape-determining protein MreD
MRRAAAVFLTLVLLRFLVSQVNHELSPLRVSLFLGGLFVVFAALRLERREGIAAVIGAGLLHDASSPVWFGLHTLLFTAAHAFVFHVRHRVHREETAVGVVAALLANLGILLVLALILGRSGPPHADLWPRVLGDLLLSQVVLAVVAPWFLALQSRVLAFAEAGPAERRHR